MKRGVSVILLFNLIFISLIGVVSAACVGGNSQIIMKLYSSTNSHGALWNQTYPYDICYDEIFGVVGDENRVCSGSNKVLGLYDITNAHAEIPALSSYGNVCYGDLVCEADTSGGSTCIDTDKEVVVRLYSQSNSHISNASDTNYPIKICCKEGTIVSTSEAEWQNMKNQVISVANVSDKVKLVLNKDGIGGKEITYDIYECEAVCDYTGGLIRWFDKKIAQTSAQGFTTWNPENLGTYYFKATVEGDATTYLSGDLEVTDYENTRPTVLIIKPVKGANYTIVEGTGKTGNIPFEQISVDPDDELDLIWTFGDDTTETFNDIKRQNIGNTTHSYTETSFGTKLISVEVIETRDSLKQNALDNSYIFVFRQGINPIAVLTNPPMDGSLVTTDMKVAINAKESYANNCSYEQTSHCAAQTCYEIIDALTPANKLYCYNLDKNNLLFEWKFYDESGQQEGNTLTGNWNDDYNTVVEFNHSFEKPGMHTLNLRVGYAI